MRRYITGVLLALIVGGIIGFGVGRASDGNERSESDSTTITTTGSQIVLPLAVGAPTVVPDLVGQRVDVAKSTTARWIALGSYRGR
jgi:hypothetical protein